MKFKLLTEIKKEVPLIRDRGTSFFIINLKVNVSFIKVEMYTFLLFRSLFKIFAEPPLAHLHNYR